MNIGVLGIVILPLMYAVPALVLYMIIRFGVKHGMHSYYADVEHRAVATEGSASRSSDDPPR